MRGSGVVFVCVLWSIGFVVGDTSECGLPEGVEVPEEIIIGGLAVSEGPVITSITSTALRVAVDLVNRDKCLLPETHLNLVLGFDQGEPVTGLKEFFEIQSSSRPAAWVGLGYSAVARTIALASPLSETPVISGTASLADLSAPAYSFFSRVIPSDAFPGFLLADLCNYFKWDRVAVVSETDPYSASIYEAFINRAAFHSLKFLSTATFPLESSASSREDYLSQIASSVEKTKASGARIILLSCLTEGVADFFRSAIKEGMVGPPYTYLVVGASTPYTISIFLEDDQDILDAFKKNIRGLIAFTTQEIQPGPIKDEWAEAWSSADTELFGVENQLLALTSPSAFFRDAVYTLAWALDRLLRRGVDPHDGEALLHSIQMETDFDGLTGHVNLKENGDRYGLYDIKNAQDFELGFQTVGYADESGLFFERKAVFSDGSTNIPDAAEQVFVDWGDPEAIVMLSLSGVGLFVTFFCLLLMMYNRATPIMNYASPRFVNGMAIGVVVGFVNVLVWTGEPSASQCQARPWLLVLNFVLVFGHLYAKAFRFLLIMKRRKKLLFRPIPDLHLFLYVFCYFLVFSIPCIIWTAAFPLEVTRSDENPDNDKVNLICDGESATAFLGVLLGLGGLSLLVGVVVAFLNREYHDFFSEAMHIGYTLFTVCVTCCVVLPMIFILDDTPHAFYVVLMLGLFLSNASVVVFMFFPKIYVIFHPEKNVVPLDESGSLKTKRSTTI